MQALKLPVLPLRTFRTAGVHIWIVTTDKKPTVSSFSVQINADVVDILIQEIEHAPPKQAKGEEKVRRKVSPPSLMKQDCRG